MDKERDGQQISFFDLLSQKKQSELVPNFKVGQDIFILCLDVVECGTVENVFVCNADVPYYGYSVDHPNGLHTTTWDTEINSRAFHTALQAQAKAEEISKLLVKISPSDLVFFDSASFEYVRKDDGYLLTAEIAKVGPNWLYEHKFMCYEFLRPFDDSKKRDKAYNALLKDITSETERAHGTQTSFKPITLYKTASGIFASRKYAERNMACIEKSLEHVNNNFTQEEEMEI